MTALPAVAMKLRALLEPRKEVLEAYLFGSAATGAAQTHSDVDVAVYLGEPRPPASAFGYAADLSAALTILPTLPGSSRPTFADTRR